MSAILEQIIKFAGIGILNTAVDFSVINALIFYFNKSEGTTVGIFAVISFTIAVLHSYFWNKYWAFSSTTKRGSFFQSVGQFIGAAIIGAVFFLAVLYGAGRNFPYYYYLGVLGGLLVAEFLMWKLFRLKKHTENTKSHAQFVAFVIISAVGAVINFLVLKFGTSSISPQFGLSSQLWANVIKAGATGISLIWNFIGYKIFVFKD